MIPADKMISPRAAMTAAQPLKWRPCEFKACGRTEHIGRARWNAKLGGWEVREMRPGYPPAPSLYGPAAVYSVRWLTRTERDAKVSEAREYYDEMARRHERHRVLMAICEAISAGGLTKRGIIAKARKETGANGTLVAKVFAEEASCGSIERVGHKWTARDDLPF